MLRVIRSLRGQIKREYEKAVLSNVISKPILLVIARHSKSNHPVRTKTNKSTLTFLQYIRNAAPPGILYTSPIELGLASASFLTVSIVILSGKYTLGSWDNRRYREWSERKRDLGASGTAGDIFAGWRGTIGVAPCGICRPEAVCRASGWKGGWGGIVFSASSLLLCGIRCSIVLGRILFFLL